MTTILNASRHRWPALCALMTALLFVSSAQGATWYVDVNTCPATGDGSSASPFCAIQSGIDAAADGDVVTVAPGTYAEAIDFGGRTISVVSTNGPDATTIDATGLDASVVDVPTGSQSGTAIEGFTLTGGTGKYYAGGGHGGGVRVYESTVAVRNCHIVNNASYYGAGINADYHTSLTVSGSSINRNDGNGISFYGLALVVDDCDIIHNTGDGVYQDDGGYSQDSLSMEINASRIFGNAVGVYVHRPSSPGVIRITNSAIVGNHTWGLTPADWRGEGGVTILNGAGLSDLIPFIGNCTIVDNDRLGVSFLTTNDFDISNSIIYNSDITRILELNLQSSLYAAWVAAPPTSTAQHIHASLVRGLSAFPFILDRDPGFVANPNDGGDGWGDNPDTLDVDESANDFFGDLRLRGDSPCVDAGDNARVPAGIDTDINGNARVAPFVGAGARVDIGAYEAQAVLPCGDGICGLGESCLNCPRDCGECCGNGVCGYFENCVTCPADCACRERHVPSEYPTIMDAIAAAAESDRVVVAPGTYDDLIDFQGKNIVVASSAGPYVTRLSQPNWAVHWHSGERADAQLQGFTMETGTASQEAIRADLSSPTIKDCIFTGQGTSIKADYALPTISDCTFERGPIGTYLSHVDIRNCSFFSPNATDGDWQAIDGGDSEVFVTGSTLIRNAAGNGPLVSNEGNSYLEMVNSLMVVNGSSTPGSAIQLTRNTANAALIGCTIYDSSSGTQPTISNTSYRGVTQITNSIVWSAGGNPLDLVGRKVTYSAIAGGYTGAGNISDDPQFVDPASLNFHLQEGSPCIDAGDNVAVPAGATTDLDGLARIKDDWQTDDTGVGGPPTVDMGSFEVQSVLALGYSIQASRYFSVVPRANAGDVGFSVTLNAIAGFPAETGRTLWVGPPREYPDEDSGQPGRTFVAASLQCEPYYQDWSSYDVVNVFGGEVLPGSEYALAEVPAGPGSTVSLGTVHTGVWGDVAAPYAAQGGSQQPDFGDINQVVEKFLAATPAPLKAQTQLQPNVVLPNRPVDFNDISAAVAAFLGTSYVDSIGAVGPCTCPSAVTCGATACSSDGQCGSGYCIDGACTDACGRCSP